jgi:hypothetical protein
MNDLTPAANQPRAHFVALQNAIMQNTNFSYNLAQNTIIITEDKIRLCLNEHLKDSENKSGWLAPAGILITILATLATTTFKDFFYLEAAVWKALFIICGIADFIWLLLSCIKAWNASTVGDVVDKIKEAGRAQIKDSQ